MYLCYLLQAPSSHRWTASSVRLPTNSFFPQVVLTLGSSLWLDPVECTDFLPINKITLVKFSLRDDILKSKHAVENPDHIPNLRKLCSKAGIQIGLYIIWTLKCSFFTSWVFMTTFFYCSLRKSFYQRYWIFFLPITDLIVISSKANFKQPKFVFKNCEWQLKVATATYTHT